MAHIKNKVVEYLNKHLIEKYLKNKNVPSDKKQQSFVNKLQSYGSTGKCVYTFLAGCNYCITSKAVSDLQKRDFRSLIMAFKTLSECVDISESWKLPASVSKKFKESGGLYAYEWARRAEKLLKSKGESNAVQEKDLVKHNLLQSGSVLNDNFWKSQKEYFKKLGIQEAILDDIKKVYQKCS